ncbi:hypothetical protein ACYOEI_09545 [Singulisphaera rosea]
MLKRLGFTGTILENRWRTYRHDASDILIVLAAGDGRTIARESDVISVRRYLVDNELVEANAFDDFVFCGH